MAIETIELENGVSIEIEHDQDCENPYQDDDGIRIVILHRRYSDPSKGACGRDPEDVADWCKKNAREWFITNLFMYEHSGVALRAGERNPFGDPWDSGQVGIIALKKSEWGKGKGERNAKRLEYAKNAAEHFGQWMNGETYGFVIKNADDDHLDACWGFIGMEDVEQEARAAAGYYVKKEGERLAEEAEDEAQEVADELEYNRPDLYN